MLACGLRRFCHIGTLGDIAEYCEEKTSMRKSLFSLLLIGLACFISGTASATIVQTSSACPGAGTCDGTIEDSYSYLITASDEDGDLVVNQIRVTVTNTSTDALPESLIDQFFFNLALMAGDTASFDVETAYWTVTGSSSGVHFDYTGDSTEPAARLGNGYSMSFIINFFDDTGAETDAYLSAVADAATDTGQGAGGGDDSGQSDLLCSSYDEPPKLQEPGTLGLLGLGLIAIGVMRRRRPQVRS